MAALQNYAQELRSSGKRITPLLPEDLKFKRKPKRLAKPVPEEEVGRLLNEVNSLQDKLLIEILAGSGLRASEVACITFKNLQEHGMLRVIGKGNKERSTFLTYTTVDALHQWVVFGGRHVDKSRRHDPAVAFAEYVRDNPEKGVFITRAGKEVKALERPGEWVLRRVKEYTKYRPHGFRHFWVTDLLNNGADLLAVKQAAGHESISTTLGYNEVLPRTTAALRSKHSREQGRL